MDLSASSLSKTHPPFSLSSTSSFSDQLTFHPNYVQLLRFRRSHCGLFLRNLPSISRQNNLPPARLSNQTFDNDGFVLEDVPHLTNFLPDLPSYPSPLQKSQAYSIVKNTFVNPEDVVAQTIVVQKDSRRGVHFRRAGPREKVYFKPEEVRACIVTCGGLCPGINTVIREIVCGLNNMYGVKDILGIEVIDKSFGFDTAVEEAQRAINAAHVEVNSVENGIGIVKLMGRYSGFIAMHATLASRDVDCCLIPESPFYLEGRGGLFEFIDQRLKENGHLVIVVAEGAGQEYVAAEVHTLEEKDASGNKLLLDVGPWLSNKIKDHFTKIRKIAVNMKYIDPTYMIRAIPSNASDNVYCTLLAHSAVHGAMAGYSGFTVGPVNSRHAYLPIARVTERPNTVELTGRMWARLLESTNQPSFVASDQQRVDKMIIEDTNTKNITSI
ncbi:ATP-dependent 6-phosphofructokinase 4, chloroplastic isoform X2 [Cicer arietinum]|uniref:ATP-dependent 6-phosphofructokinase 4, chloroplastic isoform X2 n=1 Tax=Cicer arietinum TaxID=3827 RepID=A0A1S2XXI4_CICAR|nr:ATP-dependent 6-phosphofructokinase 4, chloroplastic isoform X2 [Cicer arietinum]